jgi:hypothetical protein
MDHINDEELALIDRTCFVCNKPISKENFDTFDNTCFIQVHKECKKTYRGLCPICGLSVKNEKRNKCLFVTLLSVIGAVFTTGLICFFVILGQNL